MADQWGTKLVPGDIEINSENVIGVAMQDLSDKDCDELEQELQREQEEVMAERRRKKLASF
jgi:hypothetical protein